MNTAMDALDLDDSVVELLSVAEIKARALGKLNKAVNIVKRTKFNLPRKGDSEEVKELRKGLGAASKVVFDLLPATYQEGCTYPASDYSGRLQFVRSALSNPQDALMGAEGQRLLFITAEHCVNAFLVALVHLKDAENRESSPKAEATTIVNGNHNLVVSGIEGDNNKVASDVQNSDHSGDTTTTWTSYWMVGIVGVGVSVGAAGTVILAGLYADGKDSTCNWSLFGLPWPFKWSSK